MRKRISFRLVSTIAALVVAVSASAAMAGDADPTFGSRTDKPDGSSALTVGRRLPTPWEAKVGADVSLAAPSGIAASDNLVRGGVANCHHNRRDWRRNDQRARERHCQLKWRADVRVVRVGYQFDTRHLCLYNDW